MHDDDMGELQPLDQQSTADASMGDNAPGMANFILHLPYRIGQLGNAAGDLSFSRPIASPRAFRDETRMSSAGDKNLR